MFYLELVQNVGLLVSLVVIHGQIIRRWNRYTLGCQVFSGFLFGCVALVGMMTPVHLLPGLIFDGRSITLSVAGLFGGPVTAAIAAIMSAAYRLWLGGPGMIMGVSVIVESAGLGVAFYYLRRRHPEFTRNLYLFGFGLLVHLGMLSLTLTLPREAMLDTLEHIATPVLLIYPAATLLICLLFLDQESRVAAEQAVRESEERYRAVFNNAAIGIDTLAPDGKFSQVNSALSEMLGYTEDELKKLTFEEITHPDDRKISKQKLESLMIGERDSYRLEKRYLRKDGEIVWGDLSTSSIKDANGNHIGTIGVIADITQRKKVLESLRNSEDFLNSIIDQSPNSMWISDDQGALLRCNKALRDLMQISDDEVVGKYNIFEDNILEKQGFLPLVRSVFEQGSTVRFQIKYDSSQLRNISVVRNASTFLDVTVFPIRDHHGKISNAVIQHTDISERKRAEEALQGSEKFLEQVVENIPDMIFVKDAENLSFVKFNKAGEELLGYSREDLIGKSDYDFFPPSQAEFFIAKDREVLRNGKVVEIPEEEIDTSFKGKRTLHTKKIPILGADGNPRFLLGISEDITERKQSEEKNIRLATIVDSSDDAIIGNTLDGIMTSWNKGAEIIFGYKEHEVIGKSILILAPNDRQYEPERFLNQIKVGRSVKNVETIRQRKDGANIPVSLTVSPIIDEKGGVVGASAIARDISDRVKAEQQREALQSQFFQAQKMEAVGILAGGVAHDFNNLLQAVIGYSELLLDQKKPGDPELEDIQRIYDSGKRGADLVKSLLMFSRKVQPELRPIDLNHEIAQVRKLLSHSIPKNIKIDLRLSDALERILADPSQTGQVIMNLAINARDAMPDGGTLTIETANVELDKAYCAIDPELSPGAYVLLAVSDTGQGMDKETLSHIFEPFFTTKEKGKGTGLGLATVYGIVKQHNGRITCYSEIEHGTTFEIYLPAIQTDKAPETQTEAGPIQRGTETILLVDDEETIRNLVTRLLNKFGYKVVTANDGKEALEIYQRECNSISLIILDLIMPVMDGKKCLAEILRVNPNAKVVLASGHSESGLASGATAGAMGFVKKPYDMWQLLTRIRDILDAE